MNEQGTRPMPAQAPNNPYRNNQYATAMNEPGLGGAPYDERVKGLDGDSLDALLRARGTEGVRIGHADGFKEASGRWAEIFDQGYANGSVEGVAAFEGLLTQTLVPRLRASAVALEEIAKKTGSTSIEALAREAAAGITDALTEAFNR